MKQRKNYIDAIKGFCMLLVMAGHAGGISILGVLLFPSFMAVYFVLAGFTWREASGETLGAFMRKKAKRLLIPYFVYSAALLALNAMANGLAAADVIRGGLGILYGRHCLYLYDGSPNNLYLLSNWNGPLWFLPAMFLSYALFWAIKSAAPRVRAALLAACGAFAWWMYTLPVLMPWSLDTVAVTGPLIYVGYRLQPRAEAIEGSRVRDLKEPKKLLTFLAAGACYALLCYVNDSVNLSVRQYGRPGLPGILLYVAIGILGSALYLCAFSALEREKLTRGPMRFFAELGRRTITLLSTHTAIYRLFEAALSTRGIVISGLAETLLMVPLAGAIGLALSEALRRLGRRREIFRYL